MISITESITSSGSNTHPTTGMACNIAEVNPQRSFIPVVAVPEGIFKSDSALFIPLLNASAAKPTSAAAATKNPTPVAAVAYSATFLPIFSIIFFKFSGLVSFFIMKSLNFSNAGATFPPMMDLALDITESNPVLIFSTTDLVSPEILPALSTILLAASLAAPLIELIGLEIVFIALLAVFNALEPKFLTEVAAPLAVSIGLDKIFIALEPTDLAPLAILDPNALAESIGWDITPPIDLAPL